MNINESSFGNVHLQIITGPRHRRNTAAARLLPHRRQQPDHDAVGGFCPKVHT